MRTYDTLLTGFLIWICFSIVIFILFPIFLPKLTVETNYYLFSISIILILSALVLTYFIILRKEQNEIESSLMSFKNKGFEIFTKKYEKLLYSRDIADVPKIGHILFNFNVLAVAQPNNIEELKLIIKFCERYKIPIIPRGSGTSGYGGVLPVKNGIIINLHHFNRIIALNRNDMTVNVECGVTWENLRKHLVDQGYTLQTYPSSGLSSTVGGWISQGGYGIGSSEYGGIASSVNEVKIIGTEGREFKSNDPNDFVNSCGTLGIVIEAKLKISVLDKLIYVAVSSQNQKALLKAISDYQHLKPYFLRYIDYQTISWENQSITKINLFETTKNCKGGIISMSLKKKTGMNNILEQKQKI
jgi:FAD/FMN-containing dehydrogenase